MLSNDSVTVRKDQSYEIALTEYRGKIYGYTRSEFIVNDTLYYIVKRVKGVIEGDVCEVKDDETISYNFRGRLDKGVKVVNTFRLNKEDSSWYLDGMWKTNSTKKYYSLTGKTELKEEKDLAKSKLFPHLEELRLADDVAFYKEQKKQDEKKQQAVETKKEPLLTITKTDVEPSNTSTTLNNKITPAVEEKKKTDNAITSVTAAPETINSVDKKPNAAVVVKNQPKPENSIPEFSPEKEKQPVKELVIAPAITKAPESKPFPTPVNETKDSVIKKEVASEPLMKVAVSATNTEIQKTKSIAAINTTDLKKPEVNNNGAAALVNERRSEFTQSVTIKSDSLQLALYDNGEIDGDTVSILLNGEVILSKQGLKATAIRKTIYITPGKDDSLVLVLYAENLGKYPPNTGLLVVRDGEDVYNVRFSADFQKNAALIFRRKKE